MTGTLVVMRRELGALFFAPLAWILLFAALLLNGYVFASMLGYPLSPYAMPYGRTSITRR